MPIRSVPNAQALVTSIEATIEGFKWQANKKLELGNSYLALIERFRQNATAIRSLDDLSNDEALLKFACATCSLSEKSRKHIDRTAQLQIINSQWDFNQLGNTDYINRLVDRFLLTSGDSLGGEMRNEIGKEAQKLLTNVIIEALINNGHKPKVDATKESGKVRKLAWDHRLLFFDKKPKLIGKSIDFILLGGAPTETLNEEIPKHYLACGELKGGIDPAGADEHWKTAGKALQRVRDCFNNKNVKIPSLYFVAAAIEHAMAIEIFDEVNAGTLTAAANLTKPDQIKELVSSLLAL